MFQLARRIVPTVEPVTAAILDRTVEIMDTYPGLMARDCLHTAHCLVAGLEGICSFDTDFDQITEITRIEPEA